MNTLLETFLLSVIVVIISVYGQVVSGQESLELHTSTFTLEPGSPIEHEIKPGQIHSYLILLVEGEYLRAVIDQLGIDIIVTVFDPNGIKFLEIDSRIGTEGQEIIVFEVNTTGAYCLRIEPIEKNVNPGHYEARIEKIFSPGENLERIAKEKDDYENAKVWIHTNAIPIRTVEAGNGFDDLQPLKKIIGNARIVALGEATHGTREFFQLKHRMLEFLVNEMGFTVFAMEASMPEGFDVNQYILTGEGDPGKALAGLNLWVWDTEEVLDMIQWMRKYNEDNKHIKKVKFYGFDMQYIAYPIKQVNKYLDKVDPEQASVMKERMEDLSDPFNQYIFWTMDSEKREKNLNMLRLMLKSFDDHRNNYARLSSDQEWEAARQNIKIIEQSLLMFMYPTENVRDSSMAENIRWILDREGQDARMVIWAHNDHIATTQSGWGMIGMGQDLREMFGDDYLTFGLAFNQGTFHAAQLHPYIGGELHSYSVDPAPEGTFEASISATGLSIAAIDFRDIPKEGPVHNWFNSPHETYDVGGGYEETYDMTFEGLSDSQVLPARYDAIFFVDKTTASRQNKSGDFMSRDILDKPENLDFEQGFEGYPPPEWQGPTRASALFYQALNSEDKPWNGKLCAVLNRIEGKNYGSFVGSVDQMINATSYRAKKIILRAAVRVEASESSDQALLWMRVYKQDNGGYYSIGECTIRNSNWTEYEFTGEVSDDAIIISYGFSFAGYGKAFIDAITFDTVDK